MRNLLFLFRLLALLPLAGVAGCELTGGQGVLEVDASGSVGGVVFLDRDGDHRLDPAVDAALPNVKVSLLLRGTRLPLAEVLSDAQGEYWVGSLPVGRYEVALDAASLGDSLRVVAVEPLDLLVSMGDTSRSSIAVGRPVATIAEFRAAAPGRRMVLEGVALNGWGTFGDSTLHVADATGALRAVQVPPTGVVAGDSVRLEGVPGRSGGEPVLVHPILYVRGRGEAPGPALLSTDVAARADGGRLDAAVVGIADALVLAAVAAPDGELRLRVDDGSGLLEVVLSPRAGIVPDAPLLPGVRIAATGLLVPDGDGSWRLKPRGTDELSVTVPPVSTAEVRRLPTGSFVSVEGIALNGWATFGDAALHLGDATGALRVVRVPSSFVFAGDSVRIYGMVGVFNGRPALLALADPPPALLRRVMPPSPVTVGTAAAARADGGALDAALVRVRGTVRDTAGVGEDFLLALDDDSGPLSVVLAGAAGLSAEVQSPGADLEVTGLLVPLPGGRSWILRPRTREDLVRR